MPPKYVRSRRRGIVSLGHYFFPLFQQLNVFPFYCLFVGSSPWPASLPSATRTRRQSPAGRAGLELLSRHVWGPLNNPKGFSLKSKSIAKALRPPYHASPLLYPPDFYLIKSHCVLTTFLCVWQWQAINQNILHKQTSLIAHMWVP